MIPGFRLAGLHLVVVQVGGDFRKAFSFRPEPHHEPDGLLFFRNFYELAVNDAVVDRTNQ